MTTPEEDPGYWRARFEAAHDEVERLMHRLASSQELIGQLEDERDELKSRVAVEMPGMVTDDELADLQQFKKERARGVIHTPGYILKMSAIEARVDAPKYREDSVE